MRKDSVTTPAVTDGPSLFRNAFEFSRVVLFVLLGSLFLDCNSAKAEAPSIAHELVGSWKTTLEVPAFGGGNTSVLLSFTADHVLIETDTPTAAPILGSAVLGNGQGAWKPTGQGTFAYVYLKEIYPPTGGRGTPVGLARTVATVSVSDDGNQLTITNVTFTFSDANGNVVFTATGTGVASRIVVDEPATN
jgi:hypothetical protein